VTMQMSTENVEYRAEVSGIMSVGEFWLEWREEF
jgi:hypothetical protein